MYIILLAFSDNKQNASLYMDAHKAWITKGIEDGVFLMVGSIHPDRGGAIIAHGITPDALTARMAEDPFVAKNIVQPEVMEITPSVIHERLKFLLD